MAHGWWRRIERTLSVGWLVVMALVAGCDGGDGDQTDRESSPDVVGDGADAEMRGEVIERCGLQIEAGGGDAGMGDVGDASGGLDGGMVDALGDTSGRLDADATAADTGDSEPLDAGAPDAGEAPMLPDGFTFDSEYQMRFSDFEFLESSPGSNANDILENFLDQSEKYPIIVLLHLDDVSPDEGTIDLRGGAGLKVEPECDPSDSGCEYTWDTSQLEVDDPEELYHEIELNPQTGELRGGLEKLDFIGTVPQEGAENEKFTIPIRDIYFHDAYLEPTDDGVEVEGGRVEGYVTREAAEDSRVKLSPDNPSSEGIPVADLLYQNGQNPVRYDADGDGDADSWCLSAKFSAVETTIVSD